MQSKTIKMIFMDISDIFMKISEIVLRESIKVWILN